MPDIRQSSEYAKHLRNLGWRVNRVGNVNYFSKKILILGHILKIQRPKTINYKYIDAFVLKNRVFQIVVEPKNENQAGELKSRGYRLSRSPYLPTKTLLLKLTNKKSLFENFPKKTKYAIRKSEKVNITRNPPIESFHASWKNQARFSQYVPALSTLMSLEASFGKNILVLVSHNNINEQKKFSAGSIFLKSGNTVYYWLSFSGIEGRTSLAQYAIIYQGILWGISRGVKFFDFEGIYDPRFPNKRWLGFTHFKKQFGGQETTYPGAFVTYFWQY